MAAWKHWRIYEDIDLIFSALPTHPVLKKKNSLIGVLAVDFMMVFGYPNAWRFPFREVLAYLR